MAPLELRIRPSDNGYAGIITPTTPSVGRVALLMIANRGYVGRFVPSRNMTILSISFNVTTVANTDDPCDVGIYDSTLVTLLGSAGATSGKLITTAGVKNIPLFAAVPLIANTVYYSAFSYGAVGGTAAQLESVAIPAGSASYDLFGTTAGLREWGIKAAAHPLAGSFTPQITLNVPVLALRES